MRTTERLTPKTKKKIRGKGADFTSYRDRPVEFAYEVLGIKYLTPDTKSILESVRDQKITNVQASHGVGKSFISGSVLTLWWVFARHGLCITTAPTERQVKEIVWSEIRRTYGNNKGKLGGKASGEMFLKLSERARAFGFTARSTDSQGFQGIHGDLLIIEDEACGISPPIDEGAEACLTGASNRMLRIGNPIADGTPFAKACKESHIKIPAWHHSNVAWAYRKDADGMHRVKEELRADIFARGRVKAQGDWGETAIAAMASYLEECNAVEIPGAISVQWIEDVRRKYGEGSAFWESRVEARFPLDNAASILPRRYYYLARLKFDEMVATAKQRGLSLEESLRHLPMRYGVDVGDGGDAHAIARWQGDVLWAVREIPTKGDELDTKRAASQLKKDMLPHAYNGSVAVDNIGVGAGTLAILKDDGIPAHGIRWGEPAQDSARFANNKSEQFWQLREAMERGEIAIAPLDPEIEEQLIEDWSSIYYEELPNGKIKIEKKIKTRERIGRSPNMGEAPIYGYYAQASHNPFLS